MKKLNKLLLFSVLLLTPTVACGKNETPQEPTVKGGKDMKINITSSAFKEGELIPSLYTCDGKDISPPLEWDTGPEGTKSYAIISDDPDAPVGTWVHWVIFNIPPDKHSLSEDVPKKPELDDGTLQGINDFRRNGYGGPCPPGGTHRYFFKIYALDTMLKLSSKSTKNNLLNATSGHILAKGELIGKYKR